MKFVNLQSNNFSATANNLRVLFFAQNECWPPDTGAKLRNYYLVRELSHFADVTYLGFTNGRSSTNAGGLGLDAWCEKVITVPLEGAYSPAKILRGIFGKTALPILNYTTEAMTRQLKKLLSEQTFDAIQVELIHLTAYWSLLKTARNRDGKRPFLICDWHNIESELMRRYSECAPNLPRRWYARMTAQRLAELEKQMLSEFDAHTVVSERERAKLLAIQPRAEISVIENGVDIEHYSSSAMAQAEIRLAQKKADSVRRILFVGSMDYHANIDAVCYFVREVWPQIFQHKPEFIFTIVGRNPTAEVRALAQIPGVEITGTVDDVRPYYDEALAAVVPLRIGGGSRLKILEAMAAGVPIISTSLGAEGLAVTDRENVALADTAQQFCNSVLEVIENETLRNQLVTGGLNLVRSQYDWSAIGASLRQEYLRLLSVPTEKFVQAVRV